MWFRKTETWWLFFLCNVKTLVAGAAAPCALNAALPGKLGQVPRPASHQQTCHSGATHPVPIVGLNAVVSVQCDGMAACCHLGTTAAFRCISPVCAFHIPEHYF